MALDQIQDKNFICPLCGRLENKIVFTESAVNILKCRACGHIFSGFPGEENYAGYFPANVAELDHYWWREAHGRMYEAFGRRFLAGQTGRLLDFGCGLGYFLKKVKEYPGWEGWGVEISPVAAAYARDRLELNNIINGDIMNSGLPADSFDLITLWDVIEHIRDPFPILAELKNLLKPDGRIFIHAPNVKIQLSKARLKKIIFSQRPGKHYLEARDHLNHYSPRTIRTVLERAGFEGVRFFHLPPIQSVTGSQGLFWRTMKNSWYYAAVGLAKATGGRMNYDNLFVAADKK